MKWLCRMPVTSELTSSSRVVFRFRRNNMFPSCPSAKALYCGSICEREVACSTSDRQGLNFEYCVCGQCHLIHLTTSQAWGQSTRYFGTLVLEYRFFSTRRYSVLLLLKSTCTRTCTQVLLKMKVLLTSTYEYFTSTSHPKLI